MQRAVECFIAAGADVGPATLLLLKVEARRIREEEPRQQHAGEAEPGITKLVNKVLELIP